MLIQFNSRQETEISGTSDFRLRTSKLFVKEYRVIEKKAEPFSKT